ncbi:hypothetical protein [Plebeiibacterium marinum]|uniref:Uncharacterized protein n=1 Tax=Plebeiibacterium marinum TaxID=2992111 RepID=A0AAE3SI72_9BACT|nr:hypothetical protein [Plebeiobacterium marinum]MCW3804337.1 hypothetical protein [Plebeiobacterium marinum]
MSTKGEVTFDDYMEWLDSEPKKAINKEFAMSRNFEGAIRTESFMLWYTEKYRLTPDSCN